MDIKWNDLAEECIKEMKIKLSEADIQLSDELVKKLTLVSLDLAVPYVLLVGWKHINPSEREFRRWLINQYRPITKSGYVSNELMIDKKGRIAYFFRWLGRTLLSKEIYRLGTRTINPAEEMIRKYRDG